MNHKHMSGLLNTVRRLAYDTGWLSAKIVLGSNETAERNNRELVPLIKQRDDAFSELQTAQQNMHDELMQWRGQAEHLTKERSERIQRETDSLVAAIREFGELMKGK